MRVDVLVNKCVLKFSKRLKLYLRGSNHIKRTVLIKIIKENLASVSKTIKEDHQIISTFSVNSPPTTQGADPPSGDAHPEFVFKHKMLREDPRMTAHLNLLITDYKNPSSSNPLKSKNNHPNVSMASRSKKSPSVSPNRSPFRSPSSKTGAQTSPTRSRMSKK